MRIVILFGMIGAAVFALCANAFTADLDVCPTCPYTTIQSAIDAAADGDRVRVAQGTYFERLQTSKSIVISGGWTVDFTTQKLDPRLTVVDANFDGRPLFIGGPSNGVTIQNITFQNGKVDSSIGGGVSVASYSGPVNVSFQDVIIQDSDTTVHGGGIGFIAVNHLIKATLANVIVRGNHADAAGGGVGILTDADTSPGEIEIHIINSLVYSNSAKREAGGLMVWAEEKGKTKAVVINSTITGNRSDNTNHGGGGVVVYGDSDPDSTSILEMYNTILYGNTADPGADLTIDLYGTQSRTDVHYSDVNNIHHRRGTFNQGNNLNTDPLFLNPASDNFHLRPDSPLIDTGTLSVPSPPGLPSIDIEGKPRSLGGVPDIGAYESDGSPVTPEEGTLGTEITIAGSGFGTTKGKVLIQDVAAKVLQWKDGLIECRLTKALAPGSYDVTIQPKGGSPVLFDNGFTVKAPESILLVRQAVRPEMR
jgi:IPT/TIG domain